MRKDKFDQKTGKQMLEALGKCDEKRFNWLLWGSVAAAVLVVGGLILYMMM